MIAEVRQAKPLREVARRFHTQLRVVQYWLQRTQGQRLDRVDWSDRRRGCRTAPNRTSAAVEDRVLAVRKFLREQSALGEYGPQAIRREMMRLRLKDVPTERTIARIV